MDAVLTHPTQSTNGQATNGAVSDHAAVDLPAMGRAAKVRCAHAGHADDRSAKNQALLAMAEALAENAESVLAANALDIADGRAKGLSEAILDRLLLNEQRMAGLAADTRAVATLADPVGAEIESRLLPSGMRLSRRRIPIGVLGVIYEARPNVTIDIATLALKTGNAVILRGGSETLRSNVALVQIIHEALASVGLPREAVQYIDNPDRQYVAELLRLDEYVDMIIPRGRGRAAPALQGAEQHPRDHRRHRRRASLRRRERRPGQGGGDYRELENPEAERLQRAGYAARPRGGGGGFAAEGRRAAGAERCRAAGHGRSAWPAA